jgi:hypothetical protein
MLKRIRGLSRFLTPFGMTDNILSFRPNPPVGGEVRNLNVKMASWSVQIPHCVRNDDLNRVISIMPKADSPGRTKGRNLAVQANLWFNQIPHPPRRIRNDIGFAELHFSF